MTDEQSLSARWRKSSYSGGDVNGGTDCVEVALLDDGRVAVRDSKHPGGGVAFFTRSEMAAFLRGVKASEFDSLS